MKISQAAIDMLRDAMPLMIAQNIIGVSPMVPPNNPAIHQYMTQTFGGPSMRTPGRGTKIKKLPKAESLDEKLYDITNNHYRNFLRLNNRRKTQNAREFLKAGYPEVKLNLRVVESIPEWLVWMDTNIGQYNYFYAGALRCFLVNNNLKTLYLLRWN